MFSKKNITFQQNSCLQKTQTAKHSIKIIINIGTKVYDLYQINTPMNKLNDDEKIKIEVRLLFKSFSKIIRLMIYDD